MLASIVGGCASKDTSHHFYIVNEHDLLDIPHSELIVGKTPMPPEGYEIERIDVVVRLRRQSR
jgi:Fur family transcriptional regulator, iron response regulator